MKNLQKLKIGSIIFAVFLTSVFFASLAFNYKKQLNEQILVSNDKSLNIVMLKNTIADLRLEIVEARSSDKENDKIERAKPQLVEWVYKYSQISRIMTEEIVNDVSKTSCPLFLLALMKTESNFNPTAVSSKGAMGLGQTMPIHEKALIEAGILKEMRDIFNISIAIKATEFIWGIKISQASGNINKALALYLGGSSKSYVNQILKDYFQLNYLCKKPLTSKKSSVIVENTTQNGCEHIKDYNHGNEKINLPNKEYVYTVKIGDTLSKIAQRVYGEVNENIINSVKNSNPDIKDISLIQIGQKIVLPVIYIRGNYRSPNLLDLEEGG